jgi:hypothetical protein
MARYPRIRYFSDIGDFFIDYKDFFNNFDITLDQTSIDRISLGNKVETVVYNKFERIRLVKEFGCGDVMDRTENLFDYLCNGGVCHLWFDQGQVAYSSFSNSIQDNNEVPMEKDAGFTGTGLSLSDVFGTTLRVENTDWRTDATLWHVDDDFRQGYVAFWYKPKEAYNALTYGS